MTNQPIKLLGYVSAGFPSPASDYMERGIDLNQRYIRRPSSAFLFEAPDQAMTGAHIPQGATLIVDRSIRPKNNSTVLCQIDGEYLVRLLVKNMQGCLLMAANPKFRNIQIAEGMDFLVCGVVVAVIIELGNFGV